MQYRPRCISMFTIRHHFVKLIKIHISAIFGDGEFNRFFFFFFKKINEKKRKKSVNCHTTIFKGFQFLTL